MEKYALVFPGQGAQQSGMGKSLYDNSPAAKKVFETANKVLGYDITDLCFNGTNEELMKTINSQPCILTVSIATFEALKEKMDIFPSAYAGHSLGEYSALYASGAVDLESILKLIQKRAILMNEAATQSDGAMAAIIGLNSETVSDITKTLDGVYVANYNSPVQIVITGDRNKIINNIDKFKQAGARKTVVLAVSGAFHSPYMKPASDKFNEFINNYKFKDIKIPVYTNVDAKAETIGINLKKKLPEQIYSSVMWTQTINNMKAEGINNFIEIGPGKVLAGLNKKINEEANTLNIYDYESLMTVVTELKEKELV